MDACRLKPPTVHGLVCCSKCFGGCTAPLGLFPTQAQRGLKAGATSTAADGHVGLQEGLSHLVLHSGLAVGMENPSEPPACAHRPSLPSTPHRLGMTDLPMGSIRACL